MPSCPRECAGSYQSGHKTEITARESIEFPQDRWDDLNSKEYKVYQCNYCKFVWAERLYLDSEGPTYWRSAIGYYGGISGQTGWHFTPHEKIPNYPDRRQKKWRR